MEMTQSVACFLQQTVRNSEKTRLCRVVALKKRCFSLADVQSDVLLLSLMHITTLFIDQQLRQ